MPRKMKVEKAAKIVVRMILNAKIPSHRVDNRRNLQKGLSNDGEMVISAYFDNPYVFGYECILHVNLRRSKVEVSWSSLNRSVSHARANLALYTQVTDLAALIEAFLHGVKVKT